MSEEKLKRNVQNYLNAQADFAQSSARKGSRQKKRLENRLVNAAGHLVSEKRRHAKSSFLAERERLLQILLPLVRELFGEEGVKATDRALRDLPLPALPQSAIEFEKADVPVVDMSAAREPGIPKNGGKTEQLGDKTGTRKADPSRKTR